MKISACLITKNEEKTIERCINSFKAIVNEIIVVDTGSNDKTVEIAQKLGAIIFQFEWDNNFSNARNFALNKVSGDWVIFLDADEYFVGNSAEMIPKQLSNIGVNKEVQGVLILRENIDDKENSVKSTDYMLRIFRNNKHMRYKGHIHEYLNYNKEAVKVVKWDSNAIKIGHTGYSSNIITSKVRRNLKLLSLDVEQGLGSPMTDFYLSDCYLVLRKYEEALKYAERFIKSKHKVFGFRTKPYENIIHSMLQLNYDYETILNVVNAAIEKFPHHPKFTYQLAKLNYFQNYELEALNLFVKAIDLQKKYNDDEANSMVSELFLAHYYIGSILKKYNQDSESLTYFVNALKYNKNHAESFTELYNILANQPIVDVIQLLQSIYDLNSEDDLDFIVRHLANLKAGQLLMYFWKKRYELKQEEDNTYMTMLLSNKNYDEAFNLFFDCYNEDGSDWFALYTTISALLSKNNSNIEKLMIYLEGPFKNIIKAIINGDSLYTKDIKAYLSMIEQFILLGKDEYIDKLIGLNSNFENDILQQITNIFIKYNKYNLAIDILESLIVKISDGGELSYKIGVCHFKLRNYKKAINAFSTSLSNGFINNEIYTYLLMIEQLESDNNHFQQIEQCLKKYENDRFIKNRIEDINRKISLGSFNTKKNVGKELYKVIINNQHKPNILNLADIDSELIQWLCYAIHDFGSGHVSLSEKINTKIKERNISDFSIKADPTIYMNLLSDHDMDHLSDMTMILLDTNKDYLSLRNIFEKWSSKLKKGGHIAFIGKLNSDILKLYNELPKWYEWVVLEKEIYIFKKK